MSRWNDAPQPSILQRYANGSLSPPCNVEAEAGLLGAMMIDNSLVDRIRLIISASDFYEPIYQRIYGRILRMVDRGIAANPVTLAPQFEGETIPSQYEDEPAITIRSVLAGMTGSGAALIGAMDFAKQIREMAALRKLLAMAEKTIGAVLDGDSEQTPAEIIAETETDLFDIGAADVEDTKSGAYFDTAWDEVISDIHEQESGLPPDGIILDGFEDWNAVCGPIERGGYVLLGGRSSMGKSGVGAKVGVCAAKAGFATDILALEMNRKGTMRRIIADQIYEQNRTSTFERLKKGRLTNADHHAINQAREAMKDIPLSIDAPRRSMPVEQLAPWIRKRQRAWKAKGHEMRLVVIDYLGRFTTTKAFRSRPEAVSFISNSIKAAAKETGVAIVALSQVTRAVEQREDKRPLLSDLRESGDLEQDADVVVFVFREEYYVKRAEPASPTSSKYQQWYETYQMCRDRIELYAAKARDGGLHRREGYFFSEYQAIRDSGFMSQSTMFDAGGLDMGP